MTGSQIAVRLPDELLADVDGLVGDGAATSRADAVRRALGLWVRLLQDEAVDDALVAGYRRAPVVEPDEWGSLPEIGDRSTLEMMLRLDADERRQGSGPW